MNKLFPDSKIYLQKLNKLFSTEIYVQTKYLDFQSNSPIISANFSRKLMVQTIIRHLTENREVSAILRKITVKYYFNYSNSYITQ